MNAHVVALLRAPAARVALARALQRVKGRGQVLLVVGPGAELPQGDRWCLYLDAGQRCAVVPWTL